MRLASLGLAAFLGLVASSVHCHADTITFNGLGGNNGDPFTTPYTEGNFTVTPSASSQWFVAKAFGNPVPAIFGSSSTGIVDVTLNAGRFFTFSSVDLADGSRTPSATYTLTGLSGGTTVFTTSGGPLPNAFVTVASPNSAALIDDLRITLFRNQTSTYNIDNINVTPAAVPEPGSIALLVGTGITGAGFLARRRKQARKAA